MKSPSENTRETLRKRETRNANPYAEKRVDSFSFVLEIICREYIYSYKTQWLDDNFHRKTEGTEHGPPAHLSQAHRVRGIEPLSL